MNNINQPYRKVYVKGELINPIVHKLVNKFPNRRERRASRLGRNFKNKKGAQVVIMQTGAYEFTKIVKRVQHIQGDAHKHNGKAIVHTDIYVNGKLIE